MATTTQVERKEQQAASHSRAVNGSSITNDMLVILEFAERGIKATPRVDVFTYPAWIHKGRQVQRGQKGVSIPTYFPKKDKETGETRTIRTMATVFHVSQTEARKG